MKLSTWGIVPCLLLLSTGWPGVSRAAEPVSAPQIATFSIVARDPATGDFGVAVQSRYFAVGEVVPHAAADTGAIATQARGNLLYGPQGLNLLAKDLPADAVIERLVAADPQRTERQVGIVDRLGRAASFTGEDCLPWAGGRTGDHYAVQGNLLAGPQVVDAMATAFEAAPGEFANRLVYALAAGQAAGGDARGRQSAALLVVRAKGGYLGLNDRFIDLHVEDHPTPIRELRRLLNIRLAQLASARANELLQQAETANDRGGSLTRAREQMLEALRLHPKDDYGWWRLARIHLLEGNRPAAAAAAQRALLENPAWRHLPANTRSALGVPPELIDELRQIPSFDRVWHSLAPDQAAAGR